MAFTVTADHARQEQVWQAISALAEGPYQIRRMLTGRLSAPPTGRRCSSISTPMRRPAWVLRDLFQSDDGGWLEDIALFDGLVAEKLKAEAETIAAEGWKWIEVAMTSLRPPTVCANWRASPPTFQRGAGYDRRAERRTRQAGGGVTAPTSCRMR